MMYCTRCGSDLKGNKVRCPACGYEVVKMKMDLSKPREARAPKTGAKPWAPPIPDQRKPDVRDILEGVDDDEEIEIVEAKKEPETEEEEVEEDPRYVDGCSVCGSTPVERCFFTLAPLCKRHTAYMQIFVRDMPFGDVVPCSPEISQQKEGRNPTQMEAKEAGMFFTIKPYHEWRRVRK